jgi:hypothetical protein
MALAAGMGVDPTIFVHFIGDPKRLIDAGWGVSLLAVYAIWIAVLVALMPASTWMWRRKRASRSGWLRLISWREVGAGAQACGGAFRRLRTVCQRGEPGVARQTGVG